MPGYKVYGRQLTWLDYKLARRRRLLLEANVHPALKLYYDFTSNPSLTDHDSLVTTTPDLSITRATSATVIDSNGLIHEVSSGVARFDGATYSGDTASGTSNGLLVEEARTNIIKQSADFTTTWTSNNTATASNAATAPDGSVTADRLIDNSGGGSGAVYEAQAVSVSTSTAYTFSIFAKADQLSFLALRFLNFTTPADPSAWFNVSSGSVGTTGSGLSASIEGYGNGWYRCIVTFTTDATDTSGEIRVSIDDADNGGLTVPLDGTSSIYVWGAQLEAGAFPTSYIPTTTASVTRNADLITTSDVSWYDSSAATFYIKWNQAVAVNGGRSDSYLLLPYTDASNEIRVWSRVNDNLQVIIDATTNQVSTIDVTDYAAGTHEFVFGLSTNDYAGYFDGSATETDTSAVLPSIDTLYVGSGSAGGDVYTGLIKEIRYYDERLDDSLLEDLSNGDGDGYF